MKVLDALLATAGGLVVIGGIGWLLARLEPEPAHLRPGPSPGPPPPPGPPTPEPHSAPKHLATDPVPVSPFIIFSLCMKSMLARGTSGYVFPRISKALFPTNSVFG